MERNASLRSIYFRADYEVCLHRYRSTSTKSRSKGSFGRCLSEIVRKSVAHICASYTQVTDLDFCSIRLCGDCIRTSPVPEICTSLRSTTNYGKMSFWGSAKLVVGTCFVGVVMEVAKHELTVSTPEASPCVTGCRATYGAVTTKSSD